MISKNDGETHKLNGSLNEIHQNVLSILNVTPFYSLTQSLETVIASTFLLYSVIDVICAL